MQKNKIPWDILTITLKTLFSIPFLHSIFFIFAAQHFIHITPTSCMKKVGQTNNSPTKKKNEQLHFVVVWIVSLSDFFHSAYRSECDFIIFVSFSLVDDVFIRMLNLYAPVTFSSGIFSKTILKKQNYQSKW